MAATTETDGGPQTPAPEASPTRQPRIYRGELTSAVSALGLLAVMFLTKWYGVAGVPDPSAARPAISTAENAWNGLTIVRWVMLATIIAALGSVVVHASQRSHGTRTDTSLADRHARLADVAVAALSRVDRPAPIEQGDRPEARRDSRPRIRVRDRARRIRVDPRAQNPRKSALAAPQTATSVGIGQRRAIDSPGPPGKWRR